MILEQYSGIAKHFSGCSFLFQMPVLAFCDKWCDSTPMISPVAVASLEVNFSVHLQSLASKIFSTSKLGRPLANSFKNHSHFLRLRRLISSPGLLWQDTLLVLVEQLKVHVFLGLHLLCLLLFQTVLYWDIFHRWTSLYEQLDYGTNRCFQPLHCSQNFPKGSVL